MIITPERKTLNYIQIGWAEQCTLTLEVNDFHGRYSQMKSNGANVSDIENHDGCGLNFNAYDLDGNKLGIWSE